MAIERTVDQAYSSAKGRTIAHVDNEGMDELGVERGDTVVLVGDDRTVVTIAEQQDGDVEDGVVRTDNFTRQNVGASPGETVSIEAVEAADAVSMTLRPAAADCCPIDADHRPMVQNELLGTPTLEGNRVWVMVGPQQPFGVTVGSWRPLDVVETDPQGAVLVTRSTDLTVESRIAAGEDGTAADVESWESLRESVFDRDERACRNCGVDFDTGSATLEAHFVVAPGHGGVVGLDNLVTLCQRCHAAAHEHVTTPSV